MDLGLALIAGSALVNYLVGQYCVKKGHEENSPVLIASGAHLKSDTYSSLGLLIGILLIIVTGYSWIDSVAAMLFAIIILRTGYIIIRKAISGIMDESDDDILHQVVRVLNEHRLPAWIDIHNLRVINYAGFYHIDCHLTVPFYFSVQQGHDVLMSLTDILRMHFKDRVEFFIHVDPCQFAQCSLCAMHECSSRAHDFKGLVIWTEENIRTDANHQHSDA
jgi:cation diffusion facilitator family transporter